MKCFIKRNLGNIPKVIACLCIQVGFAILCLCKGNILSPRGWGLSYSQSASPYVITWTHCMDPYTYVHNHPGDCLYILLGFLILCLCKDYSQS